MGPSVRIVDCEAARIAFAITMSRHFLNELRASFAIHATRPALIYQGRTFTYGELEQASQSYAGVLQRSGGRAGGPRGACSRPTSCRFSSRIWESFSPGPCRYRSTRGIRVRRCATFSTTAKRDS